LIGLYDHLASNIIERLRNRQGNRYAPLLVKASLRFKKGQKAFSNLLPNRFKLPLRTMTSYTVFSLLF
jgi:hypothetical protein